MPVAVAVLVTTVQILQDLALVVEETGNYMLLLVAAHPAL
jgi:hypothetical protein